MDISICYRPLFYLRLCTLVTLCTLIVACERTEETVTVPGVPRLSVWAHAGQAAERDTIKQQVARFNREQEEIRVELTFIPERSYNMQVQAAAIAGDLPDVLEFDAPYLYNYAWQGHLSPLDELLPEHLLSDLLPSIISQGTYQNRLYGVGTFDSGLALYTRRSVLEDIGFAVPQHPAQAWSVADFEALLVQLAARDADGAVLDLKLNYPAEWFSYGFSPVIQSAGGDLIDRGDYLSAEGKLNGPEAVKAMGYLQAWLQKGLVDANVDDAAFVSGRVALSWAGHWEYRRYQEAFGDDLIIVPLPNFGEGTRTGQGSWVWGSTRKSRTPEAAATFVEFLLRTEEVLAITNANGAVPATRKAAAASDLYREGGVLHLFVLQLTEGYAVPRPQTPAYPVISSAFHQAFDNIRNGEEVKAALDRAVSVIHQDIEDNRGYPPIVEQQQD